MNIRSIGIDEVQIVNDLAYRIWPHTFKEILSEEQISYMLKWMYDPEKLSSQIIEGHEFYIISDEKEPLGFLGIELHNPTTDSLKIHKIYVLPNIQGRGLGKKLIEKAIDRAKENGIRKVVLNVNRFNKAVGFYNKLGFQITKQEDIDIGNGFLMEDYVMELNLNK